MLKELYLPVMSLVGRHSVNVMYIKHEWIVIQILTKLLLKLRIRSQRYGTVYSVRRV